jgi:hypothetical protein
MDRTLLQEPQEQTGDEPVVTNNETEHVELIDETTPQFRDVEVAPPLPPLRLTLEPPVEYDGKSYHEIICDFEKLIGVDYIRAEREFRAHFKPATRNEIPFAQMNPEFHTILISRAADVPQGLIKKLQIRQFTALQGEALKVFGSSPDAETK